MNTLIYANPPELPSAACIATYSGRPDFYLMWFPPTGALGDGNVFRLDRLPDGEHVCCIGRGMGWHAFCVQAETMFGVRGGEAHALEATA